MESTDPQPPQSPLAWVAAARAQVGALHEQDWSSQSAADLLAMVVELEALRTELDAVVVPLVRRIVATNAGEAAGWASAKDFVTAACGGTKGSGPALVRLAERLAELPATHAAMSAGWLSAAKATVITHKVGSLPFHDRLRALAEAELLERARVLDATDLARSWTEVLDRVDPDGDLLGSELSLERQERAAHRQRHLSLVEDGAGGGRIRGYATVEDLAVLKATLLPLAAPVTGQPADCGGVPGVGFEPGRDRQGSCPDFGCSHDGRDPRDAGARLLDALVEACGRLQAAPDLLPTGHGAPPRLVVTTTLDQLRAGLAARHGGTLPDTDALSVATVRRLACDAEVIPVVLGGRGQILDVGRTRRLVTAAIWTALVLRDRHCAFPGCRRLPIACDAHHLQPWADGGITALDNLVLLCRLCRIRHKRHYADRRIMPTGARVRLSCKGSGVGVGGIIRAPRGTRSGCQVLDTGLVECLAERSGRGRVP